MGNVAETYRRFEAAFETVQIADYLSATKVNEREFDLVRKDMVRKIVDPAVSIRLNVEVGILTGFILGIMYASSLDELFTI